MKHTLAVLVENKPAVLVRVAGLFARRGFNIDSISVGTTQDVRVSRMTLVVDGDTRTLEQVCRQLEKLINIIQVHVLSHDESVSRELALIKVACPPPKRASLMQVANVFRARIIDVARDSIVVECTGDTQKIDALLELLDEFGIAEVVRAGTVSLHRGARVAHNHLAPEEEHQWQLSTTKLTEISNS